MSTTQPSLLEKDFWRYHEGHPHVWDTLCRFADEWLARRGSGAYCGMQMLLERVRWEIGTISTETPRINNNHAAYYARLLEYRYPKFAGMFRKRQQKFPCTFGPDNNTLPPSTHINPIPGGP